MRNVARLCVALGILWCGCELAVNNKDLTWFADSLPDTGTATGVDAAAPTLDASTADAGAADAGAADVGAADVGAADAGAADVGAGAADAGAPDSGTLDCITPSGTHVPRGTALCEAPSSPDPGAPFLQRSVYTCSADGQISSVVCPNACNETNDDCGGVCLPGTAECASATTEYDCQSDGSYEPSQPCDCSFGVTCQGVCTPATVRCWDGGALSQMCNYLGQWGSLTSCSQGCTPGAAGACFGCTPGADARCSAYSSAVEICSTSGWVSTNCNNGCIEAYAGMPAHCI